MTHWKRPWCWERLKVGGEGEDGWWDCWMASLTQWTWVWVSSGCWTGKPGVLQSMGSQRVGHDWATKQKKGQAMWIQACEWLEVVQFKVTYFSVPGLWNEYETRKSMAKANISPQNPWISLMSSPLQSCLQCLPHFFKARGQQKSALPGQTIPEMLFPLAPCPVFAQQPTSCSALSLGADFPQIHSHSPRLKSSLYSGSAWET